jgi:hypothetical protein
MFARRPYFDHHLGQGGAPEGRATPGDEEAVGDASAQQAETHALEIGFEELGGDPRERDHAVLAAIDA